MNSFPDAMLEIKDLHSLSLFEKETKKSMLLRNAFIKAADADPPIFERRLCSKMRQFNLKKNFFFLDGDS